MREINKPGDNTYHYVEALVTRLLIGLNRSLQNNETIEYSSSLNIQAKNEIKEDPTLDIASTLQAAQDDYNANN